jgi:ABC-2 type transport system permease protein
MRTLLALARKDLRILTRVRSGMFFTFVWPVIVAILFGAVFAGQSQSTPRAIRVVVVDEDNSDQSAAFVQRLEASRDFAIQRATMSEAEPLVRRGRQAAYIVLQPGFGAAAQRGVGNSSARIRIGSDPGRQAETWMIEGLLMKHALGDQVTWRPLQIEKSGVSGQRLRPANGFDVTFPQGVMWAILGCVMSFAIGLVSERVHGTFIRLQTAPITRTQILGGKALACFVSISIVQIALFTLGAFGFGVAVSSLPLLVMACVSASLGFVGFMMLIAGLGRTEQAASAAGWAMLMPMTLFGGGMMPQFIMPPWMQTAGNASPVKWAILGLEGAMWRGFSFGEMVLPCAVLLAFGGICFAVGVRGLRS